MTELTEADVAAMEQAGLIKIGEEATATVRQYVAMLLEDNRIATIGELPLEIFFDEARCLALAAQLPAQVRNVLLRKGLRTVADLTALDWDEITDLPSVGVTSLDLIEEQLALMGLQLHTPSGRRGNRGT